MVVNGCKYLLLLCVICCCVGRSQAQTIDSSKTTLKVVSWNIQMLPNAMGVFSSSLRKKQRERLPWIVAHCQQKDYDVIVFQEVFDVQIKAKIRKALRATYPHQVNTKTKFGRFTSNGILIVSKLKMEYIDHVIYTKGAHEDGMAAKGCTLVEVEKEGEKLQIAGTHLQAGNSDAAKQHRASQYLSIKQLIDKHQAAEKPLLVVGDMNTAKADTARYELMLASLQVEDFDLDDDSPYTIDNKNSWNRGQKVPKQLDYIFLQKRQTQTRILHQQIIRPRQLYKGQWMDLADHYGIVGAVELSE